MAESSEPRPAPTLEEAWATEPELWKEQQEFLASSGDESRWARVPQPTVSPDASFEELPFRIERQCCVGKSCGDTVLLKRLRASVGDSGEVTLTYGYSRESNGDNYFQFRSMEELTAALNDPWYWPNRWSLFS